MRRKAFFAGGLLLLGSWCAQQFQYEKWDGELDALNAGRTNYLIYSSAESILEVLSSREPQRPGAPASDRAGDLKTVRKKSLERAREDLDPLGTGRPIDELGKQFHKRRKALLERRDSARGVFTALYVLGSLLLLSAQVLSADDSGRR